ncbi:hypothetical protein MMC10_007839 [Thelotrema lepadinum]|nr:hypothetical protein [Thelotrema lepadinum]
MGQSKEEEALGDFQKFLFYCAIALLVAIGSAAYNDPTVAAGVIVVIVCVVGVLVYRLLVNQDREGERQSRDKAFALSVEAAREMGWMQHEQKLIEMGDEEPEW